MRGGRSSYIYSAYLLRSCCACQRLRACRRVAWSLMLRVRMRLGSSEFLGLAPIAAPPVRRAHARAGLDVHLRPRPAAAADDRQVELAKPVDSSEDLLARASQWPQQSVERRHLPRHRRAGRTSRRKTHAHSTSISQGRMTTHAPPRVGIPRRAYLSSPTTSRARALASPQTRRRHQGSCRRRPRTPLCVSPSATWRMRRSASRRRR